MTDLLVTGASGQLGAYVLRELQRRDMKFVAWSGTQAGTRFGTPLCSVDLSDKDSIVRAFHNVRPRIVFHAAAMSTIAGCHANPETAERVNVSATGLLCELSAQMKARILFISTDLVFDGKQGRYQEADSACPLSIYGQTKWRAEQLLADHTNLAIVRVSLMYGPTLVGRPSFFDQQIDAIHHHGSCTLFEDEWRTPISLTDAANGLLQIANSDYHGLLHMGGPERMSRWQMGTRLARCLGLSDENIVAARQTTMTFPEPRPSDVSLNSSRWLEHFPDTACVTLEEAVPQFELENRS